MTKYWKLPSTFLDLRRPVFMGIVNVTPDSFSDGGRFLDPTAARDRAEMLLQQGAGILDFGGESTRPGAGGIDADEELRRIVPVLAEIFRTIPKEKRVPISIDTTKACVAEVCLNMGAEIVNDISGSPDSEMVRVLRETGAAYCLTHSHGVPKTMQIDPHYVDVVKEVFEFLRLGREKLIALGIDAERIAVDPGLGFGKTTEHNWTLVNRMERFHDIGAPLLVGHSRKRFIAESFADREEGTHIVTKTLTEKGVGIIRVHNIPPMDDEEGSIRL